MAGGLAISNQVVARNGIGRFIAECEIAAQRTVEKLVEEGADLSRNFAPVGSKADPRTVPLKSSISSQMVGRTRGYWFASARHALAQEFGAAPHMIPANVRFYWDKVGRMWMTPAVYERVTGYPGADPIHHPGNPAHPYLRPAYEIVRSRAMAVAREMYPS